MCSGCFSAKFSAPLSLNVTDATDRSCLAAHANEQTLGTSVMRIFFVQLAELVDF